MQQIVNATKNATKNATAAVALNATETEIKLTVEFADTLIKSLRMVYYAMIICVVIFAIGCAIVFYITIYKRSHKEPNHDTTNYFVSDNSEPDEVHIASSCISHDSAITFSPDSDHRMQSFFPDEQPPYIPLGKRR